MTTQNDNSRDIHAYLADMRIARIAFESTYRAITGVDIERDGSGYRLPDGRPVWIDTDGITVGGSGRIAGDHREAAQHIGYAMLASPAGVHR